ncbi:MAG: tetratricopeptide repeat protein [Chthoniobacterales bacterium]
MPEDSAPAPTAPNDQSPVAEKKTAGLQVGPNASQVKESRAIELQQAVLVLGALLLVGLAFYFGTKLPYLRYLLATRQARAVAQQAPDKFPGVAAADLVKKGLVAQAAGQWDQAVDYLMAAKTKDLRYRGILFRVGKLLYDHRNFDSADSAFERAIAFGENVEGSNFYRGLIAVRHRDLTAAENYFAAAVAAAPFTSEYQYYWAETLRLDFKPKLAQPHYEKVILLSRPGADNDITNFKIRMGQIEAATGEEVSMELTKHEAAGPLAVDWLMTAAALKLRTGKVEDARQLIMQARAKTSPELFAACATDFYFREAAKQHPELAEALHLDLDLQQTPFTD